ncbi:MAG: amidophosphoribosyltransferase [Gammaproteobacteria bacterium]|nr:amidophosphoribosyltransferase [Gammaproteobacteria bacterium]|tara:strand:+ start:200468 stop:201973 length:1506 start_codon:yes stop_codon:yes gene_type:complete
MCGIVALYGINHVVHDVYESLTVLQHRGQDASGILTNHGGKITLRKSLGLVRDGFEYKHIDRLKGHLGIGHVRYPTAGHAESPSEAQPFYVNSPYGIGLAHNGNLINSSELKDNLFSEDLRHINTKSDSEILLNILAHELHLHRKEKFTPDDLFYAIAGVHRRVKGAYAVVCLIADRGIAAFRDPRGIRPLCFGTREIDGKQETMVASESVALNSAGFTLVRDIRPGEAIFIDIDGNVHTRQCCEPQGYTPCIFEYVYFARPDTILDGISVYRARMNMGKNLAKKITSSWPQNDIDVVVPIPDTSRISALELSTSLNKPFREGFIKNRYIGRTFIMPEQNQRIKSVKRKLNAIASEFKDKNVLLVDDSIVRGTTSKQIIEMARDAGAKKVYMASAAPPVKFPNVYGIDMPASNEFVADKRNEDEITKFIGADKLFYQNLDDLVSSVIDSSSPIKDFDASCFDGNYVTGDVTKEYLKQLDNLRNDVSKKLHKLEMSDDVIVY